MLRATVVHGSISQHDSIEVSDDLPTAKRQAVREFGMGFVDHTIRIYDDETRETSGGSVASSGVGRFSGFSPSCVEGFVFNTI